MDEYISLRINTALNDHETFFLIHEYIVQSRYKSMRIGVRVIGKKPVSIKRLKVKISRNITNASSISISVMNTSS